MKRCERIALGLSTVFFLLGLVFLAAPGVKFSGVFSMGLGALCLAWLALGRLAEKSWFFKACKRIFLVGICALAVLLGSIEALVLSYGEEDRSALPVDAVIVLGAGVNGTTPSVALQTRIDAAESYMAAHPEVPVVLSGGQGSGEDITEAECMYRALKTGDADWDSRFLLEDRSTSTAENFAFSKQLLEENGIDTQTAVIAVVTNDFHLCRARLIAEKEGLQTIGIPAELPWWWLTANYYLRESFAVVKTVLFD